MHTWLWNPGQPPLTRTIIEAIAHSSVIRLLEKQDLKLAVKEIKTDGVVAAMRGRSSAEMLARRTVAVLTPVRRLASDEFDVSLRSGEDGAVTMGSAGR